MTQREALLHALAYQQIATGYKTLATLRGWWQEDEKHSYQAALYEAEKLMAIAEGKRWEKDV